MIPPHLYYSSWGRGERYYMIDEDRVSIEFPSTPFTLVDSKRDPGIVCSRRERDPVKIFLLLSFRERKRFKLEIVIELSR